MNGTWPGAGAIGKLAVFHQGALGDFIAALPVMEGLAQRRPGSGVALVTRPAHASLLSGLPWILSIHPAGGSDLAPWYDDDSARQAALPRWMEGAAGLVVFGGGGASGLAGRLSARAGVPALFLRSIPPEGAGEQVTRYLVRQAREQGVELPERPPRLPVASSALASAREWLGARGISGHVHLHPGSGGARKVWPAREWLALAGALRGRGAPVVVSLGPADHALLPLAGAVKTLGCAVAEGVELPVLSGLLSEARACAGSDSGVTHLAAAIAAKTVAVFGPTDPGVWAPLGDNVRVARREWGEKGVFDLPADPGEPDGAVMEMLVGPAGGGPS